MRQWYRTTIRMTITIVALALSSATVASAQTVRKSQLGTVTQRIGTTVVPISIEVK